MDTSGFLLFGALLPHREALNGGRNRRGGPRNGWLGLIKVSRPQSNPHTCALTLRAEP